MQYLPTVLKYGAFLYAFRFVFIFCFRHQVWLSTEEYLKDALGSVVTDIGDLAINLLDFVNEQVGGVHFFLL